MRVRSRLMLATLSTMVTVTVLTGCASAQAPSSATSATPVSVPSETAGAAHFDEGFLAVGSGPKVVDLYVDPMCPYCKLFEQTSGAALFSDAAERWTTIRVHPVAILNRLSQGTAYSTRAAAVLAASYTAPAPTPPATSPSCSASRAPPSTGPFTAPIRSEHTPGSRRRRRASAELVARSGPADGEA